MNNLKRTILIVVALMLLVVLLDNLRTRINVSKIKKSEQEELKLKLEQEKGIILKDFEERTQADKASFESVMKELEEEKEKIKELQKKP